MEENKRHVQVPNDMTKTNVISPKDLLIYTAIKRYANKDGISFPSLKKISEDSGAAINTVRKSISVLENEGYIEIDKSKKNNIYKCKKYDNFEPFSYEFLDKKDISADEKALIIAEQQFMFKDVDGFGKISYTDLELSDKINMSYNTIVKYHKSLEQKGYLTTIKTRAKDSETGLAINEKIFHLDELGQAIIWTLQKHDEDIENLKIKTDNTSKDMKLVLKELERLNKKIDELENKNNSDEIKW